MSRQSTKFRYKLDTIHQIENKQHSDSHPYQYIQSNDRNNNCFDEKINKSQTKRNSQKQNKSNNKKYHKCQILESADQIQPIHINQKIRYSCHQAKTINLRNLSNYSKYKRGENYSVQKKRYHLTSCSQNRLKNNELNFQLNLRNSAKQVRINSGLKKKIYQYTMQKKFNTGNQPWKLSTQVTICKREPFSGQKNLRQNQQSQIGHQTKKQAIVQNICEYLEENKSKKYIKKHKLKDPRLKNKQNWFSTFISQKNINLKTKDVIENKQSNFNQDSQDSIQIIEKTTPGPNHYNLKSRTQDLSNIEEQCTFGYASRFQKCRPITADVEYLQLKNIQQKNNQQIIDHVSFGTSKNNLRSQIKKIQYCDWSRPHSYGQVPNLATLNEKQNAIFKSNQQRLKSPQLKYKGQDFYCKQRKSHPEGEKSLPSYYFLSQVSKGIQFPYEDERDFITIQHKKKGNNKERKQRLSNNKLFKTKKQQNKQNELDIREQIVQQVPKNTLGNKKRKINFQKMQNKKTKDRQILKQQKNQDFQQLPQKLKIMPKEYYRNTWIIPTHNVKFQSKVSFFRI